MRWLLVSILLITVALPGKANATACLASQEGILQWKGDGATSSVLYCDGSNWQNTDHTSTGAACASTTGTITYNTTSKIYEFCGNADGKWHTMKNPSGGTTCVGTTAGTAFYNGNGWVFCDGTTLWNMGPISCSKIVIASGSLSITTSWTSTNLFITVGAGGGGGASKALGYAGGGGGGGASNTISNVSSGLTFPLTVVIGALGAGGATGATPGSGSPGGDTYVCKSNAGGAGVCDSIAGSNVFVGSKGGLGGGGAATAVTGPPGTGGTGGVGTSGHPTTGAKNGGTGGNGFNGSYVAKNGGGGGGGAGGVNGVGGNGATGVALAGGAGGHGDGTSGGAGGASAKVGAVGKEWTVAGVNYGSGGGGGGGTSTSAKAGGAYGAGGGGAGTTTTSKIGGAGTAGIVYVVWTSADGTCN